MSKPQFVIRGILPALMTPFKDGGVDEKMLKKLVRFQLDQGCHGFFVNGSTGDGFLMTREERRRVVEVVVSEVAGQAKVIAHVGAVSSDEAAAMAVDARKAGADAVASVPPIYYPVELEGFELHMRTIGVAADMPTYCYYIPALTGHALGGDQFVEVTQRIPNLVGFKYTHSDMFLLWWILDALGDRISVFNGSDQMLLQGLITGACGGIGSTYNYQTRTIVDIYEAMQAGDLDKAREAQWRANQVVQVLFRFKAGGVATERAILKLMGYDVGAPRPPKVPFPDDELPALRKALEGVGFLQ
ncbi:MAG TPA: dihydrodipicolinate synthase family protein [Candidatus Hydrogenedentes bacterium]|nr:dihydrodipicolinate synthase family protein [Candidatus Hydrogenedentota bacterium]HQH54361.1 dihydrodipicolinate synthase family protein [Candidatus Hydrogenedentota bacterium]HQM50157.1 dihydrodipicolinate synthase family protein [Candidatus Hydrogenedentota bacterium]